MPSFKLFQNLRERSQSSGLEGSNLPPYSEVSKTDPTSLERFKRIASQIPQWTWCTNECRTWLKAVCIVYFNFSPEKADATAQKFEGFGPTIYMKTRESWIEFLGENGRGLSGLIFSLSRKRGAVPRRITLGNWPK
jgi:hypothetical protein